jgi:transcriptional regulator with XRE-family HTH domain
MSSRGSSRISESVRQRLADARIAKGLTQTELAKQLGRPQSFVSNYERGQRRIDVGEFIELARALDLDPVAVVKELASGRG